MKTVSSSVSPAMLAARDINVSSAGASQKKAKLPVVATYVINMKTEPERYEGFLDHLRSKAGVDPSSVRRHPGVNATDSVLRSGWARELLPGMTPEFAHHRGDLGAALAHLTAWRKVAAPDGPCSGHRSSGREGFALIFEDDERVRPNFVAALQGILNLALRAEGSPPDFVNLNVLRPYGDAIATGATAAALGLPAGAELLRVVKGRGHLTGGKQDNVWLSCYALRCSGARRVLATLRGLGYHGRRWDGVHPILDVALVDMLQHSKSNVTAWVVSPQDAISMHVESVSSRSKSNDLAMLARADLDL